MVEYLCRACAYAITRYSETDTGDPETRCYWNGTQSGQYGNVKVPGDCDKYTKIKVQFPTDRYPRRKKGTAVDSLVDDIDSGHDANDPYDEVPLYTRKKARKRWR